MLDAQLKAFAAFARTLSFTRAAEELWVSQPVVSKHVAAVEARAGVPLVRRAGRRNELTPAGEYLAKYVLQADAMLFQAFREVQSFSATDKQRVTLVASGTPGTYLLPSVITTFYQRAHGARVDLTIKTSSEAEIAVRNHQFEFGIVGGWDPVPDLESEVLLRDRILLIGPPALTGRTLSPSELESFLWIGRESGAATHDAVEEHRREMGIRPVHRVTLPSREAVKLAVAEGGGIAACTRYAIKYELEAGTLAVLDVPGWSLERDIYLIKPRGTPLTPTAEHFLTMAREHWAGTESA